MKQFLRLMAMLWPFGQLSAIGCLLLVWLQKYKRKQLNTLKQNGNKHTVKTGKRPFKRVFHVCRTLRSAPHPLRGLAMICFIVLSSTAPVSAQYIFSYKGKVVSGLDKQPIGHVNVLAEATDEKTTTNLLGEFTIRATATDALVFSKVGFVSKTVHIANRKGNVTIEVTLIPDSNMLEEVEINAGYYAVKDRYRTGNIARITADDIDKQPVSNPLLALQGRMPGVVINQQSGVPGAAVGIQIRGQNSLRNDGNHPLYIIDGMPISSEPIMANLSGLLTGPGMDPLNALNPKDIASIEILKDADATAIYGSRGANGVVLITTKRGAVGKSRLDLSLTGGLSNVPKMDMLNTKQYIDMRRESFANDGLTPNAPDLLLWDTTRYTDWQEVLVGNTAWSNDMQLSLSGGQGTTQYRFNGGWRKESMVFPGEMAHRLASVGVQINQQAFENRLFLTLSANYGATRNQTSPHNFVQEALRLPPNAPALFAEDGSLNWENGTWTNPFAALERTHTFTSGNLNVNSTVTYHLLKGLSLKTNLGFANMQTQLDQKTPISASDPDRVGVTGSALQGHNHQANWIVEPQVLYHTQYRDMSIDVLLGGTFQSNRTHHFRVSSSGYVNDALIGNTTAASDIRIGQDDIIIYRYAAAFARLGLNWHNRYLLNLTGRKDGSSRFGPDRRFGNFGAVGVAWVVSNESFLRDAASFLSFLKLRGSYGTTGNDRIGDYGYLDSYNIGNYKNQFSLRPAQLHNPSFSWEVNRKLDLEVDVRFLQDRFTLNVNWFRNTSSNQLVGYSLPVITGFGTVQANLPATIENKGWELQAGFSGNKSGNFYWQTLLNLSIPRNTLLAYPDIENSTYANQYIVGRSLSVRRLFEFEGLDEDGLYKLKDINGDGRHDVRDRHIIREVGRRYYGGIQQILNYGKWSLNIVLEGVAQKGMRGRMGVTGFTGSMQNQPVYVLDRWRKPGDITDVQRAIVSTSHFTNFENVRNSDLNFTDASFMRLRNITLSYRLPESVLERIGIETCELFVHGQNLFTLTQYDGWEVERPTGSTSNLPALRTISFGLRVGI